MGADGHGDRVTPGRPGPPVVILGADGMLGHKLFQILRERYPGTIAMMRKDPHREPLHKVALLQGDDVIAGFDALQIDALCTTLEQLAPAVIVNCVGVIKQRSQAKSAIPSITINSLLPHHLAEAAERWGGRLVHFSTDCVFSGRRGGYHEDDQSDAEDLYGKTKYLGEVTTANAVTLRTSIIGRELTQHRSLLDWFLGQQGKTVKGYRRAIYSGITTNEMANVVTRVIEQPTSGLFHVVSRSITKYELLLLIRDAYGLRVSVEPDDTFSCDRSMYGESFAAVTGWTAPSWPHMVRELAADPTPYAEWGVSPT